MQNLKNTSSLYYFLIEKPEILKNMSTIKILCCISISALFILASCSKGISASQDDVPVKNEIKKTNMDSILSTYKLMWEDNFEGTSINTKNWVVASLKDPTTGDMVPGAVGNNLLNSAYAGYITPEDTYVENGSLVLRNQKRSYTGTNPTGNYQYTSSWIMSMHRVYFNKGFVQIRAQFPSGDKVWPAIWLCAEDLIWGPEWDLWEYFGYRADQGNDVMGIHLMTGEYPNTTWYSGWIRNYNANYNSKAWHIYEFEWTDTYAKWYVDSVLVRTLEASSVSKWPNENMYLILNNGQKTDSPDATTVWPNSLVVDYIKVYQKK
jgi:beta-glucanase (GH16 family)